MKLYNGVEIIAGLAAFVLIATTPILYNVTFGESTERPVLEMPDPAVHPNCVGELQYMRTSHMDLLDEWRTEVVRNGNRTHTAPDGTQYNRSLSQTCMGCHASKEAFCDRCHNYVAVKPYCFDCHNETSGE